MSGFEAYSSHDGVSSASTLTAAAVDADLETRQALPRRTAAVARNGSRALRSDRLTVEAAFLAISIFRGIRVDTKGESTRYVFGARQSVLVVNVSTGIQ